jgi:ADP-ribose pyrophosphatase
MKKLTRKVMLETPIFTVSDNYLTDPNNRKIRRIVVEHKGSAVVLPVDDRGRVLLVKQYRFPMKDFLWELPAGKIDPGETALQGAKRELKEETGYSAKRWKKLITFAASPGFQEEKMNIFLAENLTAGEAAPDHGEEDLIFRWFEVKQIEAWIKNGNIIDAKTIIGMYLWRHLKA